MAKSAIILGPSGSGKSSAIRGLNPDTTVIANTLGKALPFKGSSGMYSREKKNLFKVDDHVSLNNLLNSINTNATHVQDVVLDDVIYIMRKEYFRRAKEPGYGKYTELAQHFQSVIQTCETLREDLNVFFLLHSEEVISDSCVIGYQVATVGKLLLNQYNPVECVPMVLFAQVQYDDKGVPTYGFYTHRCRLTAAEIPAKTPQGMFDEDYIPNDLGIVSKAMREYYG